VARSAQDVGLTIFVCAAMATNAGLVIAAWYAIRRRRIQPVWRHRVSQTSLVLLSITSAAFCYHLLSSVADWVYLLPRGPFDVFVEVCLIVAVLAVIISAFAKGFVRCAIASAGIVMAYLWLLVGALSWMW
jgi:hypothetical protein